MSSGLAPEDVLRRQAARGQPDLFPTLVEETFPRAWALLGGSREGLLFVYGSMRDHLEEVDSRTRFWDWFLQITYVSQAKFRTLSEAEIAKVPPDAVPDFLESLSVSRSLDSCDPTSSLRVARCLRNLSRLDAPPSFSCPCLRLRRVCGSRSRTLPRPFDGVHHLASGRTVDVASVGALESFYRLFDFSWGFAFCLLRTREIFQRFF